MQHDPAQDLRIANPSNFRDLGLYIGAEGRRMQRRRLFRSDHLGALEAQDVAALSALGIARVLDLRGVTERSGAVCALPGVPVHSLAIEPTIVQVLTELVAAGQAITSQDVVAHMKDTYRGFVRHNSHRFAELFGHLLESDAPLVFHCTAGKDRTGFAAALIQRALGVSQDDVLRDYLLTNERLKPPGAVRYGLTPEVAQVLWRVQPEFLQASFETVDSVYGGIDGYLRDGLQLREADLARLRALYMEPAL
ncbi:MAG: tyrosine-protein phosphatase [Comamonadaceae bacterium]|nr:MAG: tyrosine-protein phosphatase [Comamonadaceae bacterium]